MSNTLAVMVDAAGPVGGGEVGTPPLLIDAHYDCPDCGKIHLLEECPDCGSRDVFYGFGLGFGGGYGPYKACDCGWSWKQCLPEDEA